MPTPTNIDALDPLIWINEYARPVLPINSDLFEPILQFSLLWNLFERDACKKRADASSIEKSVAEAFADGRLRGTLFEEHLAFFQAHSRKDGRSLDQYFEALKLNDTNAKGIIRGVLEGSLRDANNIVFALLLIALRIRNNLFHGNKDVAMLHSQVGLFKAVNSLLATYLTAAGRIETSTIG